MADDLSPSGAPFHGRWWVPGDQEHPVGGQLGLDHGAWKLTLYGWLGPWDGERYAENKIPARVLGRVGTTPITLLDTVPAGRKGTHDHLPPFETRMWANTVLAGAHVNDAPLFRRASVRLLHLNEWANRTPWEYPEPGGPFEHAVSFADPDMLTATLQGAKVALWRGWGQSGGGLSRLTLESDEHFIFDFDRPIDLDTVEHDYVRPLRSLIELAAAEPSATLDLRVTPARAKEFASGAIVLSALASDVPEPKDSFRMLFRLEHVDFESLIPAWWQLHGKVGIVCDLLARMRDRGHVGGQFLTAASAIEAYHRAEGDKGASPEHKQRIERILAAVSTEDRAWLEEELRWSHRPSFAERIDEVVEKAGPLFADAVGDPRSWRSWVRTARDSVAHRDPEMVDVDDKNWRTTIRVTPTIEWLMILVMLGDLGIDDDVVAAGVRADGQLTRVASADLKLVKPTWFEAE